jgi:hypothetical protein
MDPIGCHDGERLIIGQTPSRHICPAFLQRVVPRSFRQPVAKRFFGGCILQGELRKYLLGRLFYFFEVFGQCNKRLQASHSSTASVSSRSKERFSTIAISFNRAAVSRRTTNVMVISVASGLPCSLVRNCLMFRFLMAGISITVSGKRQIGGR